METKHTPGPWKLKTVGDGDAKKFVPVGADNVSVLTIVCEVDEYEPPFAAVYEEADARLIAAAPKLLEALQACAAKFAEYAEIHMIKNDKEKASKNLDMYRLCHTAIAKATGARSVPLD